MINMIKQYYSSESCVKSPYFLERYDKALDKTDWIRQTV